MDSVMQRLERVTARLEEIAQVRALMMKSENKRWISS